MSTKVIRKVITIILIFCLVLTGCGASSELYSIPLEGYATIKNIDNLSFCVPSSISNKATAITKISDDTDYDTKAIYSYKNGKDEYLLFCMDELIIIAQKGTDFHFASTNDKKECLENSGILNTWFNVLGKKLTYSDTSKDGIYKIISNVSAEVVITTELYGDFIGKLAVIEDSTSEWALFVGVKGTSMGDLSDQQMNVINTVTQSMRLEVHEVAEEPTYEVVVNDNPFEPKTEEHASIESDEPTSETTVTTEESISTEMESEEPQTVTDEVNIEPITSEEESESVSEPESSTEEPTSIVEQPQKTVVRSKRPTEKTTLTVTNQKEQNREIGKAYNSDEYSMLSIGQSGILSAYNEKMQEEQPIVRINRIYTGENAKNLVEENATHSSYYDYFDPPEGYSWQVAEYDVSYKMCPVHPYIDIRMVGLDGNVLKYRGIAADERTHDANFRCTEEDDTLYGCLVYYAVPNGCKEYSLKCGEGTIDEKNKLMAAYYYIKIKKGE